MTDIVAGVDLGGTAINYTFADANGRFLLEGLCEHPARAAEGPSLCMGQIVDGLAIAANKAGIPLNALRAVGLDTPGPASAKGVLSAKGSTNFVHADWAGFDLALGLQERLGVKVTYLNDGNAAALWGHFSIFGANAMATSITCVIGTGLGGGIVIDGKAISGRNGFGGELGHVLVPFERLPGLEGLKPVCNCGRFGDLEAICSLTAIGRVLLPYFLPQYPDHPLASLPSRDAAKRVRGMAEAGDPMCRAIFSAQARTLGLFYDQMINTFDPDALLVGGGALETGVDFQRWFLDEIRAGMPAQRAEQADIPIHVMPNGDTAGARGAAIEALKLL
jgi:predicted NBD/HSP70 family sugar kinase